MRSKELGNLRDQLLRRRSTILETAERAAGELEALRGAERDPEFEEGAQREHEQYTLTLLGGPFGGLEDRAAAAQQLVAEVAEVLRSHVALLP